MVAAILTTLLGNEDKIIITIRQGAKTFSHSWHVGDIAKLGGELGYRWRVAWNCLSDLHALPNDEAQTPRWGYPNSMVFSQTLRVIGVVCSAWFAAFEFFV